MPRRGVALLACLAALVMLGACDGKVPANPKASPEVVATETPMETSPSPSVSPSDPPSDSASPGDPPSSATPSDPPSTPDMAPSDPSAVPSYQNGLDGSSGGGQSASSRGYDVRPDFSNYPACGRPCWLPLYPTPQRVQSQMVTNGYPFERYGNQPGDVLHVVCQEKGQALTDQAGNTSNVWDWVVVPRDKVVRNAQSLPRTPDGTGYYALGSDLWLGNGGMRLPCR